MKANGIRSSDLEGKKRRQALHSTKKQIRFGKEKLLDLSELELINKFIYLLIYF